MPDTFECPSCGEEVPSGAKACPHCGADENTGWNEDATRCDGLDLPDAEFDHDDFVKREFGSPAKPRGISWLWWTIGILLVLALLFFLLGGRLR